MSLSKENKEKAILIGLILNGEKRHEIIEQLNELKRLTFTAGGLPLDTIIQNRNKPDPATFIGKGKLNIIKNQASELKCKLIIFNNEISPSQLKNIQKYIDDKIKVIDRTGLILDIFTKNAKTKESKTQVELAQLEYLLPRLTRQWTHLERQMGGVGTRAGAGETQIEVDRRLIRDKISKLKFQLSKIQKQRITQNKSRSNIYKIALVGYTNAGKSSLMNQLTNSNVLVKDKLFATLDTTTRKFELTSGLNVLISDTVGFIRNIPHNLIASFRSTLSEVNNVDMLLKVFDISSSNINDHIETVNNVLASLEVKNKKTIFILNKIDLIENKETLNGLKIKFKDAVFISTKEEIGINILIESIVNIVSSDHIRETIFVPYNKTKIINLIYQLCQVVKRISMENSIHFDVKGSKENIEVIKKIISK